MSLTPWVLFFRRTVSGDDGASGVAHGDCAPWNLLRTDRGWVLIDWENAWHGTPPFFDLFHFLVQASIELRRPSRRTIIDALHQRGHLRPAIEAYADGSKSDPTSADRLFLEYLSKARAELIRELRDARFASDAA